jgi:hypothetical protein
MTDGVKTSEFWLNLLSTLGAIIAPLIAVAVVYGVFTSEQAEVWTALLVALLAALSAIVPAWVSRNYTDNRTSLKIEVAQLEAIRETRLERLNSEG